jgi:restriction endonuclease Mrr
MAIFGLFSSFKKFFSDEKDVPTNQHATYKSSVRQETLGQRQARHRQDALLFVKQNHQEIKRQKHKEDAWHRSFAKKKGQELSQLTGIEFEQFLAGLFRQLGYGVEMTASTGDYGADLILSKAGEKIAVQAKCYSGSVGVSAVQEVLAGQRHQHCRYNIWQCWCLCSTRGLGGTGLLQLPICLGHYNRQPNCQCN